MFKSTGRLIYDPKRGTMKRNLKWWAVVNTDSGLVDYYANQVRNNPTSFGETHIDLKPPSWGSHVSVIRGEEPRKKNLWRRYHNKNFTFEYSPVVRRGGDTGRGGNDSFFFIDVFSPDLMELRYELGLPVADMQGKPYKFHLTVGRVN